MSDRKIYVHIYLTVRSKDGSCVLSREVELPFRPKIGDVLIVGSVDEEDTWDRIELTSADYVIEGDCYWCEALFEDNFGCPCDPYDECCVLDSSIPCFIERGWELFDKPVMLSDCTFLERLDWQFTAEQLAAPPPTELTETSAPESDPATP